jgi:hypothetical protein
MTNKFQSYYAASRLWTDAILIPDTELDFYGIEGQPLPIEKKFNLGVIQV